MAFRQPGRRGPGGRLRPAARRVRRVTTHRHRPWLLAAAAVPLVALAFGGGVAAARSTGDQGERVCATTEVAARGLPAVVTVQAEGASGAGTGSGEVIRGDGYILTN